MYYRTQANELLDAICYRQFGTEQAIIDVLELNPGLADDGEVLPEGIIIQLPDSFTPPTMTTIDIWS